MLEPYSRHKVDIAKSKMAVIGHFEFVIIIIFNVIWSCNNSIPTNSGAYNSFLVFLVSFGVILTFKDHDMLF